VQGVSLARITTLLAVLALAACGTQSSSISTAAPNDGRIPVVTTFSTLNSFVNAVGGKYVRVTNLVPIGASPEDYQPTPQDIATLGSAKLLVMNGAGIEAWLSRTLANANNPQLVTIVAADGLPVKVGNPHLWMNPDYAKAYVQKVRDALTRLDPPHREYYAANAQAYDAKLDNLSAWIAAQIKTIPPERRKMIVFHNAWEYYNERFGLQTLGVIETSPGQEPNPQQLANLIDLAKKDNLRAVFSEPEYSPKLVQAVARSAGIKIVENLYDDSIGDDPRVLDYISMLTYDTNVIVNALK
jgi:manganese/iron transport system substrate-binding protein